jgi:hypothetical protein
VSQDHGNRSVISFYLCSERSDNVTGSELSKTVAIFIVQKILLDDTGLNYICHTYERFYAVGTVLSNMVAQVRSPSSPKRRELTVGLACGKSSRAPVEACGSLLPEIE